ncbi:acetylornithine deacetylase [Acuticoccus sediminis]|uniref:acetylornithine deacetylase n=1 Tax=Acuticoccus sediminis TaxID=2184697 RepID=UPI001CFDA64A|nr:acetylornithine deacetylase [Acuticoccus sediminis]
MAGPEAGSPGCGGRPSAEALGILDRLIAFPSVVTAERYTDIAEYAAELLAGHGAEVHRLPNRTGTRTGLFARVGPAGPGGVLLSAHLDVVPVAGQGWTTDPFRMTERDGKVYGRGTTDMKGYAALALAAAVRASRMELSRPLKLSLSYDEEVGCVGIAEMIGALETTIGRPDHAVIGEPTGLEVAVGHKGKASYRVVCRGEAGHSSDAPRFMNALHLAADVVAILRAEQERLTREGARDEAYGVATSTIHVGTLQGGSALNIVPSEAVLEFEIRHLAGEPPAAILARIEEAASRVVEQARKTHPAAGIEIVPIGAYPGLDADPAGATAKLLQAAGAGAPPIKVSFGTEAGFFQAAGVPSVVCGPGSIDQGHKPDEFIALGQLAAGEAMLERVVASLR